MTATARLQARGITKQFRGFCAINNVSLSVDAGEIVGLIGPSGSGKSTLMRCMAHLESPDGGSVLIDGQPPGRRGRPRIGFVFQSLNLWPHLTALENVTKGLIVVQKKSRAEAAERATTLIASFGLGQKLDRRPGDLSGGERQRIAICRALAMEPAALLFDEPTSALDPELVGEVASLLKDLKPSKIAMVVTTHDIRFAGMVADRLVFLERGEVVEVGRPEQLLAAPQTERLRAFLSSEGL